jgi:hypothetical protein
MAAPSSPTRRERLVPRPSPMRRAMPVVGLMMLLLGLVPAALTIARGGLDMSKWQSLAGGLFMASAGVGMIQKGSERPAVFWGLVGFALVATLALFLVVRAH